jgi:hypothetical protein
VRPGEATREFEAFLRSKVVGQDAAIEAVTELYQIFLAHHFTSPGPDAAHRAYALPIFY